MEKRLKEMTVADVVDSQEFLDEMTKQVSRETETLKEWQRKAVAQRKRLQRSPIDSLMEREVFTGWKMVTLYRGVLNKALIGFSAAERKYITDVGTVVYAKVIRDIQERERREDDGAEKTDV